MKEFSWRCLGIFAVASNLLLVASLSHAGQGIALQGGVILLTGVEHKPYQTQFALPEIADPYVTFLQDSVVISGTAQYHLKFSSVADIAMGGPYQVVWNEFLNADGTQVSSERGSAHSWDMRPVLWASSDSKNDRLWDSAQHSQAPRMIWYGGQMRPPSGSKVSYWPRDNFSRDVFAFTERAIGKWTSQSDSIFASRGDWPRAVGDFRGHRYGSQIVEIPKGGKGVMTGLVPAVFYEQVTETRLDGFPRVTRIFVDEMSDPLHARGKPLELISPLNPLTGKPYPSALREDGSALVEGPLYFQFMFEGELWEAIAFSAGSFYGKYSSCFASRRVLEGLKGMPYRPDLSDDGGDFFDAGAALGRTLNLAGGPGRPSVIVRNDGKVVLDQQGRIQVLFHAYRRDILPDHDFLGFPLKYGLTQMFRGLFYSSLQIKRRPDGRLRFEIGASSERTVQTLRGNGRHVKIQVPRYSLPESPSKKVQSRLRASRASLARSQRPARHLAEAHSH